MKTTKTITITIVSVAVLIAGISQMHNIDGTISNEVQALIGGEGTLAEQRAAILESGKIPDNYLISKTGEIWESHMTPEEIANFEWWFVSQLNIGKDTNHKALSAELSLISENFATLAEKPGMNLDEVSAVFLQGKILDGTYVTPTNEAIQQHHTYILGLYDLPNTTQGVDDRLTELTGEMAPLTHIAVDVYDRWAEAGVVAFDLHDDDSHYWWAIFHLLKCEHNGDADCSTHQDHLDNKRWLEEDPEFIEPP